MDMIKIKKRSVAILLLLSIVITACGCGSTAGKSLSEYAIGKWNGQVDVAAIMYQGLGDELGIDLSPEPKYCSMDITFNEDGTYVLAVNMDEFAQAAGKCVEPYVSAIIGFSTESLVDLIMQYVAEDMSAEDGMDKGTYVVDDEQKLITVSDESGDEDTFYLTDEGTLQYEDTEIGQVITFQKQ